jgi:hypothetical protein
LREGFFLGEFVEKYLFFRMFKVRIELLAVGRVGIWRQMVEKRIPGKYGHY